MEEYKVIFNKDEMKGVFAISLVGEPAIGIDFLALSKEDVNELQFATVDTERRIVISPVLIPEQRILRIKDGNPISVYFDAQTIEQVQRNFSESLALSKSTIEHSGQFIDGVCFVETWIKEDDVHDKSVKFGFDQPVGTWFVTMSIENDTVWNDYVKTGKVKGLSIDGLFKFEKINFSNMTKEDFLSSLKSILGMSDTPAETPETPETPEAVALATETLADGVTVLEAENFAVGQPVFVKNDAGENVPAPAGDYELASGQILVVDDAGVIQEIKEAMPAENEELNMSKENINAIAVKLASAEMPADIETIRKAVQILFNDRFSWEIQQKERESLLNEVLPEFGLKMAKEIAATIEAVEKRLDEKLQEQVEFSAKTKAKPEVTKRWEDMTPLERFRASKN